MTTQHRTVNRVRKYRRKSRLGRRILIGAIVVLALGALGGYAEWRAQTERVKRATQALSLDFPKGMNLADAQKIVDKRYPEHTSYAAADCENLAYEVPPYKSQGGPCTLGIIRIGGTWWQFESDIEFRLMFDADQKLAVTWSQPVYTFF